MLIEWHLSNRPCGGPNVKQFRALRAFTLCTGHRWRKTTLFVFCSSLKSVWLCFCFVLRHLCPVSRSIKMSYFGYNTLIAEWLRSFLPLPNLFEKDRRSGDSVRRVQFQNVALEICVLQFQCTSGTPAWTFSFFLIFIKKIVKSGLLGCHAFLIFRYCIYCVGLLVKRCRKKRFSKQFI